MVTQASSPSTAPYHPKRSIRAESRLKISEGLKRKVTSPKMRAASPAILGKVSISPPPHSSAHCNDDCQQVLIQVGMEQESSLSSVGGEAGIATPSMVVEETLPISSQLLAHDPGDQATFNGFEMEQASSLSHLGSYVLQQTLSYMASL
jgi:hypothetical protein